MRGRSAGGWARRAAFAAAPVAVVVAAQIVLFPTPVGVWVQGVVLGLLGALMALGLALVYRLNQVVNFAQGDLGAAPGVLAFGLVGLSGVNYFLGLATGLVGVLVLTLAVEVLVIRRFARSPRLMLTVATIGLSQTLTVVSLLAPNIWGQKPIGSATVHFPWHISLGLSPVVFSADDLVGAIVAVAALGGVALWLRFTDLGIAARAAGDNRDRAAVLGIPVNRIQTVTWLVAGVLSYLSVFLKAAIVGLPLDPVFSLTALMGALAALALGGFTNLPLVAVAAVAVGTLEQGVAWDEPSSPTLVLAVLAAVVVAALFVRLLTWRSSMRPASRSWALGAGVREMARAARRWPEVRLGQSVGAAAVLGFAVTLPLWLGPGSLLEVSTLLVLGIVGVSLVVLTGWAGQVSLGQMGFAAVGAVTGAVALIDWHFDLSLALLMAGTAAAVAAAVVGLPTLRLEGVFAAVTTFAFGLASAGYLLDRSEFSWIPSGELPVPRLFGVSLSTQAAVFATCLGASVVVVAGLWGVRHSRFGRVLRAASTNERAVAAYGVHVDRMKVGAFAVSGFVAGVAGCLLVVVNQQYVESSFAEPVSLAVFTATAVGGLGSVVGAVAGAALVEGSVVFLPPSWQLFPPAIGVLLVLIAFPGGLASLLYAGRDRLVAWVGRRRGVVSDAPAAGGASSPGSGTEGPAGFGSLLTEGGL